MSSTAELNPQIKACVDSYLLQNGYHDLHLKEVKIKQMVSEQFKASLPELNLVSAHINLRLAEKRKAEQRSQELWFNDKPPK